MSDNIDRLARIEEKLIALHNANDEAHKNINYNLRALTEQVKETNGKVGVNCEKLAVLEEQNDTQKWINRVVGVGFIGCIISKFFNLW